MYILRRRKTTLKKLCNLYNLHGLYLVKVYLRQNNIQLPSDETLLDLVPALFYGDPWKCWRWYAPPPDANMARGVTVAPIIMPKSIQWPKTTDAWAADYNMIGIKLTVKNKPPKPRKSKPRKSKPRKPKSRFSDREHHTHAPRNQ